MADFMMVTWLIFGIAFLVTIVILIVNKLKKKQSKFDWKLPTGLLIASTVALAIGVSFLPSETGVSTSKESTNKSKSLENSSDDSDSSDEDSYSDEDSDSDESSSSNDSTEESDKASSVLADIAARLAADKDPNSYNTGITYEQIARTPGEFMGKKMQFTGKVLQVMEGKSETQLRLAVDGDIDNVIYISFDPKILNGSRVLDDDLITAYGTSIGTITYKSTMRGDITIPGMIAKIINNQGKASDDYGY
ncbi:hypothetical protein [Leuconostoc lactis]|uniref:hypothetical protein n=1 Tax=Leuconostoc lactis TaxID=1246 RepID=UPI00289927EF|nr:hypothetical protein [Leuconostoc lactis]